MRLILLISLAIGMPAFAECSAKSGDMTTPLVELFTSEGCSSCPPADEWLSRLEGNRKVVPLAFHVDYWDYIGWKDRFASPDFSGRQRDAASLGGATFVYTPQVMLNGRDFRDWRNTARFDKAVAESRRSAKAKLAMKFVDAPAKKTELQVSAKSSEYKDIDIYVALYENNLSSRVIAGENNGRKLRHDFVVREWFGPYRFQNDGQWQQTFSLGEDWKNREGGTAMLVQQRRSGEVLQALALEFCP